MDYTSWVETLKDYPHWTWATTIRKAGLSIQYTQAAMAEGHGIHQLDRDLKGLSTPAAWWQLQALNLGYSDPEDGTIDTKHTSSNGGNGMDIWQRRAGRDRNT